VSTRLPRSEFEQVTDLLHAAARADALASERSSIDLVRRLLLSDESVQDIVGALISDAIRVP